MEPRGHNPVIIPRCDRYKLKELVSHSMLNKSVLINKLCSFFCSPSGCTFWGKKPWSRKKKILWQLGTLVGAPVGITLLAGIAVPAMIIGIPVWVGRKVVISLFMIITLVMSTVQMYWYFICKIELDNSLQDDFRSVAIKCCHCDFLSRSYSRMLVFTERFYIFIIYD